MFKPEWNKKYATIAFYAVSAVLIATLGILILINLITNGFLFAFFEKLLSLISPLIYAFVIAYLLNPLMKIIEQYCFAFVEKKKKRRKLRRALSVTVTFLVVLLCITLFIVLIIPQITSSYEDLSGKFSSYIESAQAWADNFVQNIPLLGSFSNLDDFLEKTDVSQYLKDLISDSGDFFKNIAGHVVTYAGTFVIEIKNALFGLILSVYFLFSKELIIAQMKKVMTALTTPARVDSMVKSLRYVNTTFGSFLTGKILEAIIIGLLTFIVLGIFNIPFYPIVSLIVGVTDIIPIFGPFIGSIPSAFIIFLADPIKAIWFIVIVIVIQQLDANIIGPKILGESTGLSSMWVIISLAIAGGLFGVAGMILGVPLFAVLYVWTKRFIENRLKKRSLPVSTLSYFEDGESNSTIDSNDQTDQ